MDSTRSSFWPIPLVLWIPTLLSTITGLPNVVIPDRKMDSFAQQELDWLSRYATMNLGDLIALMCLSMDTKSNEATTGYQQKIQTAFRRRAISRLSGVNLLLVLSLILLCVPKLSE